MKMIAAKLRGLKSISLPINLQRREKSIIIVGCAVLAVLIFLELIIFPVFDRRTRLREQIKTQTKALNEIRLLKTEYESLTRNARGNEVQLKRRSRSFTLFSFLDKLAGKGGIKQNIVSMKPSTINLKNSPYSLSIVELKLQLVTMEQLVAFIHGIETSNELVWIKSMSIYKGEKDQGLLNSLLHVETYQQ